MKIALPSALLSLLFIASAGCAPQEAPGAAEALVAPAEVAAAISEEATAEDVPGAASEMLDELAEASMIVGPTVEDELRASAAVYAFRGDASPRPDAVVDQATEDASPWANGWRRDAHEGATR